MSAVSRLDGLAERLEPRGGLDDLQLSEAGRAELGNIAREVVRNRAFEKEGLRPRIGFPLLFAGERGTGKRRAAEALAAELGVDLYRVDLSDVVSKFIGETEKHLDRLFDASEASGAILFLEEGDALLGKRSDVEDSHDRYANIEVSYLLQRMEASGGLAILTTNRTDTLDPAFLRRLRHVVRFPLPSG